jgi:HAD superfamily hydrolase (TIGR01549 family)
MSKGHLISFDLDGTLVDFTYSSRVWEVGVPQLYAQKHAITLSEATAIVTTEYERTGDVSLEWYDIAYWFKRFDLPGTGRELMEEHRKKVHLYPEVKEVLGELRQRYELIVISNAAREFIDTEMTETGIEDYFTRIFSATSDFEQVKKTPQFYKQICDTMGVLPAEMIHVGDHYQFDYVAPRQLGVEAYFLDRNGSETRSNHTVKNLKEFVSILD